MKAYSKILVLVVVALFLTLAACSRTASTPPAAITTPTGVDFPFVTEDPVSAASTQTAMASQPLPIQPTDTPQVVVATNTPESAQPQTGDQATATPVPAEGGPAPTLAPLERPQTYTLQQGEFPFCIARRYDLDLDSFFRLNGINNNTRLAAGAVLKIPATGNWNTSAYGPRALKQHPATVTVVAGQTVYSIACQFGDVAPEHILAANGLQSAADVKAGMTLNIP